MAVTTRVVAAATATVVAAIVAVAAGGAVSVTATALSAQAPTRPAPSTLSPRQPASFHHLHLMAVGADTHLVGFYERLFPPAVITRGKFWDADGIRGDGAFLLWSRASAPREYGKPTAIWHFGWGKVSLGETYAAHLLKEVNWKPPYPGLTTDLHVHLRSRDPIATAEWYELVLGAKREVLPRDPAVAASASASASVTSAASAASTPPLASSSASATAGESVASADTVGPRTEGAASHIEGEAEALVRLGPVALVIHWTDQTLEPTRSVGPIDHLSFQVTHLPALTANARAWYIRVLDSQYPLTDVPTLTLEGPDRITIELLQRPKGPDFWHDRP
jgi:hypothetical protein